MTNIFHLYLYLHARRDNQLEIYELAEGLVNFYKGVLNRGRMVAPIEREIHMIRSFVETTRKVYCLHIEMNLQVPLNVQQLYTVKLFLQPLVENAILHGIRPNGSGTIDINAELLGDRITFIITDDGIGIEADILSAMRAAMAGNEITPNPPYRRGVLNVYKRMKLFFCDASDMNIESQEGEGTTITLTIPASTQEGIDQCLKARQIWEL